MLQDIESYHHQRQVLMLLKYLARGSQDEREGGIMTDEEADKHFQAKLAAMKSGT